VTDATNVRDEVPGVAGKHTYHRSSDAVEHAGPK
jgi:hypothetical protein